VSFMGFPSLMDESREGFTFSCKLVVFSKEWDGKDMNSKDL
jgi:hypothetical protein